jgi:hypothetical protein
MSEYVALLLVLFNAQTHEIIAVRTLDTFSNLPACLNARERQKMAHATRGYEAVYVCAMPRQT